MKKLFRGRVRLILLLAVLLAAATALTAALSGTAWGSRTVQAVLTPFRSGFSALTRQAERYYNYLFNYESLSAENDYLRRQISSMENEVRTADSLQRENERLKELLGLQEEHEDYRFNEAYIVSWDSSSWKSTFTIGKGTRSGLETGMVVVTEYGRRPHHGHRPELGHGHDRARHVAGDQRLRRLGGLHRRGAGRLYDERLRQAAHELPALGCRPAQ